MPVVQHLTRHATPAPIAQSKPCEPYLARTACFEPLAGVFASQRCCYPYDHPCTNFRYSYLQRLSRSARRRRIALFFGDNTPKYLKSPISCTSRQRIGHFLGDTLFDPPWWTGTTAGKYASQRFSDRLCNQPKGCTAFRVPRGYSTM